MKEMEIRRLQPYHLDVLKEISNIGVAHAATSLSHLINERIEMNVPNVRLVPLQQLSKQIGDEEAKIAAVFLRVEGDLEGGLFFLTSVEGAEKLIQTIAMDQSFQLENPPYDEFGLSAFQEIGNILAGSYLSALSDFTSLNLQNSVPSVNIDMVGSILNSGLIPLLEAGDDGIFIDTEIKKVEGEEQPISGNFLFLPDPDAFQILFEALGVNSNE